MQPVPAYFLGLAVLLAATATLIVLVQRPLHAILIELCGAEHRATFWARLYSAALVVGVLFFSFWAPPLPQRTAETVAFEDFFGLLRAGSFALLAGMGVLALLMLTFIGRHDREQRRRGDSTPQSTGESA